MNRDILELEIPAWERDTRRHVTKVVGAWLRLCIAAHTSEPRGIVRDTLQGMAAIMGTANEQEAGQILDIIGHAEQGRPSLGDVEFTLDATYTVTVRRMLREATKSKRNAEKVRRSRNELVELPVQIAQHEQLRQTWEAWMTFRRKELRKPMPPTTQRGQIAKLVQEAREHGVQAAIDMLQRSMDGGWSGIFTTEEGSTRRMAAASRKSPLEQAAAAASFFKV